MLLGVVTPPTQVPTLRYQTQVPTLIYQTQVPTLRYLTQVPTLRYQTQVPTLRYRTQVPTLRYQTQVPTNYCQFTRINMLQNQSSLHSLYSQPMNNCCFKEDGKPLY